MDQKMLISLIWQLNNSVDGFMACDNVKNTNGHVWREIPKNVNRLSCSYPSCLLFKESNEKNILFWVEWFSSSQVTARLNPAYVTAWILISH